MRLASFRHVNHLFGSSFRMGQEDAPPEPAPEPEPEPEPAPEPAPPPAPTCRAVGEPFFENRICYQLFECTAADGSITYEKRHGSECELPDSNQIFFYPYGPYSYPYAYPVTTPLAPTEIVIENGESKTTKTVKEIAPYAAGAVAVAAILYAALK